MRIFLVENHPDTLIYVRRHLERAGHEVATARGVIEALTAIVDSRPDVLLTDLCLPDGDGCSLLEMLGPARPAIAILMTGSANTEVLTRSTVVGFQAHLAKPFLPDELDRALNDAANSVSRG